MVTKRIYTRGTAVERARAHIVVDEGTGCWLWHGAKTTSGYGHINTGDGRTRHAHVVLYENARGAVPPGLELDHLCRVRACVNPDHLEAVTHAENCRRALKRDFCKRGHSLADAYRDALGRVKYCRGCRREQRAIAEAP